MSETVRTAGRRRVHGIARQARVHTPSIAFRHLPPKEGCRKPVLGVLSKAGGATSLLVIINSKFIKQLMAAGALNNSVHQGTALTSGTEDGATTRLHVAAH